MLLPTKSNVFTKEAECIKMQFKEILSDKTNRLIR